MIVALNPNHYSDPIQFLKETHELIFQLLERLESLANDAKAEGLAASIQSHPDWKEILEFFAEATPEHERDEEVALFPVLVRKVPHIGFQPADSPFRFIVEGHDVINRTVGTVLMEWQKILALGSSTSREQAETFLGALQEMIRLYREHIAIEVERSYSIAERTLTPVERIVILEKIRSLRFEKITMPIPRFENRPTSSGGLLQIFGPTDETAPGVVYSQKKGRSK